jgi:hypothetical protein
MSWSENVALVGVIRHAYSVLFEKPEGKRTLERFSRGYEDNIRMYLREIRWGGVNWMHLTQDMDQCRAFVNAVMNFRVP